MAERLFFYSKNAVSAVRGFLRLSLIMAAFMVLLTFFFINRGFGLLLFSLLSLYFIFLGIYQAVLIKKLNNSAIILDEDGFYMRYPGRELLIHKDDFVIQETMVSLLKSFLTKKKVFKAVLLSEKWIVVNYSFTDNETGFPRKAVEKPFLLDPEVYDDFLNEIKKLAPSADPPVSSEDKPEVKHKTKSNLRLLFLSVIGLVFCFVFFFLVHVPRFRIALIIGAAGFFGLYLSLKRRGKSR